MIGYASRTGTLRNLAALGAAGWRLLLSARGRLNPGALPLPFALDNGAWAAHQRGEPFCFPSFERALELFGARADWVVSPDIVAGGLASLRLSLQWLPRCLAVAPRALLAVQDGMTPADVRPYVGKQVGLFVGGTTPWKLATLAQWGQLGREAGCWVHVGRVNSAKRISACAVAGAHSFDGSSVSRYVETLPLLDRARRQLAFGGLA